MGKKFNAYVSQVGKKLAKNMLHDKIDIWDDASKKLIKKQVFFLGNYNKLKGKANIKQKKWDEDTNANSNLHKKVKCLGHSDIAVISN